jgi:hypothetical protein
VSGLYLFSNSVGHVKEHFYLPDNHRLSVAKASARDPIFSQIWNEPQCFRHAEMQAGEEFDAGEFSGLLNTKKDC